MPPGSVNELSKAMRQMVENYSSYNPHQIRESCAQRYGNEAFVQKLNKIYAEVVA